MAIIPSSEDLGLARLMSSNHKSKIGRMLKIAGELAPVLAMAGFRSRKLAYLGVAMKVIEIGHRLYEETLITSGGAHDYFELSKEPSPWVMVSPIFPHLFMDLVTEPKIRSRGPEDTWPCAWTGFLTGDIEIGWIATAENRNTDQVFVRREHKEKFNTFLHELVWSRQPGNNLCLSLEEGLVEDQLQPEHVLDTNLIQEASDRLLSFYKDKETSSRGYMLIGPPGCGKTTCIQHIARSIGLKSIRVPLGDLCKALGITSNNQGSPKRVGDSSTETIPLQPLLMVTKPDIFIIDDVDKAPKFIQAELLEFYEVARKHVKILLVSVNFKKRLDPGLRRPRRIDDHIDVPELAEETVLEILGVHKDFLKDVKGWPISYIFELMNRVRVLGVDKAREELPGLAKRVEEEGADPEETNGHDRYPMAAFR